MKKIISILALALMPVLMCAQESLFTLEDCIAYALENSTSIDRAENELASNSAYLEQSKAARLPNLEFNASQSLSSSASYDDTNADWSRAGSQSFSASLNSQLTIYQGAKLKNTIRQNEITLSAAEVAIKTQEELISLDILSAYVDVLLAKENVTNSQLQLEATQEQLSYAEAQKDAGSIALSDLLNIKSQLAANKTSLVQAKMTHKIALVSLMQLMNMPVNDGFDVVQIAVDSLLSVDVESDPATVYNIALGLQPSIKNAELNIESAAADVELAKADGRPQLSLNGSVGTGYSSSSYDDTGFGEQVSHRVNPSLSLSLSVPIYQQKSTKTKVKLAEIEKENSRLALIDQQNELRQYIEQACTDVLLARSNYDALQEQLNAELESYEVSAEMFKQGLLNSVDLLTSKNNLIVAENEFTQAKYNLLLLNKIVEYYLGSSIAL